MSIIAYILYKSSRDRIEIIREITKALLAKDINEYVETIPEENEQEIEQEDELTDINNVPPELLIKQLNEGIKNKD